MTTDRMLCLDPNKRSVACAFFSGKVLVHATMATCDLDEREDRIPFWLANDVYVKWTEFWGDDACHRFVGESPGHRAAGERANYNTQILPLVHVMAAVGGKLCGYKTDVRTPNPDVWKGNMKADLFLRRGFGQLSTKEKEVLARGRAREGWTAKFTEDTTTAAVLGLWRLGRLDGHK